MTDWRRVLQPAADACTQRELEALVAYLATMGDRHAAAEALGITVAALDGRLKRARLKIRAHYHHRDQEEAA